MQGEGTVIGKGNCEAPKLINRQQGKVQQPSAGAQPETREGWQPFVGMGLTRMAALLRVGITAVEARGWLISQWSLLFLSGLPWLQGTAQEWIPAWNGAWSTHTYWVFSG